jgi:23S rRNA (uracil1939-C5)-methyltransferase
MKLLIEKAIYGGSCLTHQTQGDDAGKAVFVPFTLPGELVEARLLERRNSFGEASLVEILTASDDRVVARCSHFGQCGGCNYQHAIDTAQPRIKAAILLETLERAGLTSLPSIQSRSSEPWHYRNRTRLRMEEVEGTLRLGYNRRASNEFLPIHECPILASLLWRSAEALLELATENTSIRRWLHNALEVELFTTGDEKNLQISIFLKNQQPGFVAFAERMQKRIPELTGLSAFLLPSIGTQRRARIPKLIETWGAPGLKYRVADEEYWVHNGGFFQVNRFLTDELVRVAIAGRHGTIAWDLYAGAGLFSKRLTRAFQQVVAIEAAPSDLSRTFTGPGRRAVQSTTLEFLRQAVIQRDRPQLIVMDPPRAGLGAEVCALLTRVAAPEMVYISCDPVTLGRDLKALTSAGYKITELHMVDMFPQTFHLETVAVLRK